MCKKKYYVSYIRGPENYFFFCGKNAKIFMFCYPGDSWHGGSGEKKIYEGYQYVSYRMEEKKFYVHLHGSAALKPIVFSFCSFLLGGPCSRKRISGCFNTSWNNVPGKIFENILGYLWAIQLPFAEKTGEKFQGVKELVQRWFFPNFFGPLKSLMRIVDGESLKSVDFVREFQGKFKGNSKAFSGS